MIFNTYKLPLRNGGESPISYIYYDKITNLDKILDYALDTTDITSYIKHFKKYSDAKKRVNRYDNHNIFFFDTETTTVENIVPDKSFSFIYRAMLSINNKIVIMIRTYEEINELFARINKYYEKKFKSKNPNVINFKYIVWVHNLSYDFQFCRNCEIFGNVDRVISRKKYDTISITFDNIIEFRDSYSLLGSSLDSASKDYNTPHMKMKGDLAYNLIRTPITPLTKKELGYCLGDVVVGVELIAILLKSEGYGAKDTKNTKTGKLETSYSFNNFPYTKTGSVRNYIKNVCRKNPKLEWERKSCLKKIKTTPEIFEKLKKAYTGGYTHAFFSNKLDVITFVNSFDITSDYPYQILTKKFPMGTFEEYDLDDFENFLDNTGKIYSRSLERYSFLVEINVYHAEAKSVITSISYADVESLEDEEIPDEYKDRSCNINNKKFCLDNGKIYEGCNFKMTLTDLDYNNFVDLYDCEYEITEVHRTVCGYLPMYLVDSVLHFYAQKTTLKGVEGEELKYNLFKTLVNGIYGMTVQDPTKDGFDIIQNSWIKYSISEDDFEDNVNGESITNLVRYQWGVWVTAHARNELFHMMKQIAPEDLVYCDTDSCKFKYSKKYEKLFEKRNKELQKLNQKVCKERGISYSRFCPKAKDGKIKEVGLWDNEGVYDVFKTTGSKRYLTFKEKCKDKTNVLEVTCAGIAKENMKTQLLKQCNITELNKDNVRKVFDKFDDNFSVPAGWEEDGVHTLTGKSIHGYYNNDDEVNTYDVVDHKGKKCTITSVYYITLEPACFTLSTNKDMVS